jgi:dihydroorotate dehydrogenase electron transfer subunit
VAHFRRRWSHASGSFLLVQHDFAIAMPHPRGQFTAAVAANLPLCREHFKLILRVKSSFPPTEPGQFIQIACRDTGADYSPEMELQWTDDEPLEVGGRELLAPLAMLRRPFSLAGRRDAGDGVELDIIHRVVGVGTDWLAHLRQGDAVDILGPLGNRFALPAAANELAILIGGGVGIPPMLYLAEGLAGRRAVAFCGAVTRDLLPLTLKAGAETGADDAEPKSRVEEFARHGINSVVCTDDGSYGFRGFVTQAVEKYLTLDPEPRTLKPILYTCGPEPMMKRVAYIAAARGLECQVAVERAMACGMGTCQSCCIRLRRDPKRDGRAFAGKDWIYKLACTDGPIFRGADLLW